MDKQLFIPDKIDLDYLEIHVLEKIKEYNIKLLK